MHSKMFRLLALGLAALLAACASPTSNSGSDTPAAKTLTKLKTSPSLVNLEINATRLITVTGTYSDASTADVADGVWSIPAADSAIASVTGNTIKGLAPGHTTATVTKAGKTATVDVTVLTPKTIASIAIAPKTSALEVGQILNPVVTATYSDSSTATITDVSWTSSDDTKVSVDTSGVVTAKATTSSAVTLTATRDGKSDTLSVTVAAPTPATYVYSSSAASAIGYTLDNWGSGTGYNSGWTSDATFTPVIQLTSGSGWGDVSAIAFTKMAAGFYLPYTGLTFKIKTTNYTTIKVKFPNATTEQPTFNLSDGILLPGGWVKMSIPFSSFGTTIPSDLTEFAILEFGKGNMLITDVGFTGTAPVNTAGLTAAITAAQTLNAAHSVGTDDGNVSQAVKDAFTAAITTALAAPVSTWAEVAQATSDLASATTTFKAAILVLAPTALPAAPGLSASAVISLWNTSGTYSNAPVGDWNPNWGQSSSIGDFAVAGKTVKKLNLVNYQGINIASPNGAPTDTGVLDISGKKTLHLSYWTANGTGFNLYPIWAAGEKAIAVTGLTKGAWTDLEIDFSQAAGIDLTTIRQIKFADPTAAGVYYLDNIYFH